jgi:mono/diheme cytochrome c family protein
LSYRPRIRALDFAAASEPSPRTRRMKRFLKIVLALFAVAFVGIQFVPVARTNPSVVADFDGNPEIEKLLRRACYDCHSNETHWPWYSAVAPASWIIVRHVEHGREELNFSHWGRMPRTQQDHKREECWEEVESGEMPQTGYVPLHPSARLSEADLAALKAWATSGDS